MCGIVGIASTDMIDNRGWLATGRDAMAHRGPDDAGEFWSVDGRVGLAHRRLSIIDLSPSGHQPMHAANGQLSIVFNGEIYNHRELRQVLAGLGHHFSSTSDTEVILASYIQWGRDFLKHLNGMFALAIHDAQKRTLLLARDRAGEKPLFYRAAAGEIRFGSELKALLADPGVARRIDPAALDCYLTMGYIPGALCIYQGFRKLEAGHALNFSLDSGRIESWRYWSLPSLANDATGTDDDALVAELEHLLMQAVQRQLVADVPVALLLSGGVDSSLITALAAQAKRQVKTFTVGFRNNAKYDETAHARLVADHFGTDHTLLEADDVEPSILMKLARQYDEPIVDSSMIPTYLVSQQIAQHCKVALGGDGGDELFGGYYSASRMAWLEHRRGMLPLALRQGFAGMANAVLPVGAKGRNFLAHWGIDPLRDLPLFSPQFDRALRQRLLRGAAGWRFGAEAFRQSRIPQTLDAVQRVTRFDFANYMAEDILVKVDRASMLNSLEVRSPFLDQHVIQFAYGHVPSRLKATPGDRKIILKKLAAKILPPTFDKARKQGFGIPLDAWLRHGPWRQRFEEVLYDRESIFDQAEMAKLFKGLEAGRPVKEHLFGLTFFELWRREYQATL
jgi:asparagine synthase (glutamine-hydrolysing)